MRKVLAVILLIMTAVSTFAGESLRAGSVAPDFSGSLLDGKSLSLSELQGKVVVVTFWSTRCAICHSEIPKLNRVAEHYRDKDVVFLAPTMDNESKIQPYLKSNPFNFNIMPNSFGVFLKYADKDANGNISMGFPAYFLIDRTGRIVLRTDGWDKTANLDAQIAKALSSD